MSWGGSWALNSWTGWEFPLSPPRYIPPKQYIRVSNKSNSRVIAQTSPVNIQAFNSGLISSITKVVTPVYSSGNPSTINQVIKPSNTGRINANNKH